MTEEIVTALVGLVTVLLGFVFFYFPWQTLVIDQTRQRLFEIRDSWFDYTLSLTSDSDRTAAELVRKEINYLIKLTHKVTFSILLCAALGHVLFGRSRPMTNPVDALLTGFQSREAAKRAAKAVALAFQVVTWGMIRRSIPAILLLLPFLVIHVVVHATHGGIANAANRLDPLIQSLGNGKGKDLAAHG